MASTNIKNAILRAKIQGTINDLMVKTNADNVVIDDAGTTLSAKLAEVLTSISARPTTENVTSAINALRQELLGDTPVEAYNTFTELAAYIEQHQDAADALTAAVGNKADKATTLAGYGITDAYTKTQADQKITDVVNAKVTTLEGKAHEHANKTVLDGITAGTVSAWNGKSKVFYSATEPDSLAEGDLWVQLID